MNISMIVAVASNGVIGKDGKMPWHLPSDLRHFKRVTSGHAVVMGRKTFESIGRALPDRMNVVLSQRRDFAPDGVTVVATPEAAIKLATQQGHKELFVIGGGEVYYLFRNEITRIFLAHIHAEPEGDTHLDLGFDARKKKLKEVQREVQRNGGFNNALWLKIGLDARDWERVAVQKDAHDKAKDQYQFDHYELKKKPKTRRLEAKQGVLTLFPA